ncbi:MAG: hypothetical protein HY985_08360 [Magnetospirillum sp.]|nr:hypothetical protein [Magnetospirillum sp.]
MTRESESRLVRWVLPAMMAVAILLGWAADSRAHEPGCHESVAQVAAADHRMAVPAASAADVDGGCAHGGGPCHCLAAACSVVAAVPVAQPVPPVVAAAVVLRPGEDFLRPLFATIPPAKPPRA